MMKGLMDHCMAREKLVNCLKERVEVAETGLLSLRPGGRCSTRRDEEGPGGVGGTCRGTEECA